MKPLFIPLKREYYEQFAAGTKTKELRKYGPRWNEKHCYPGRRVTLSLGYGKAHRLTGTVIGFRHTSGFDYWGTSQWNTDTAQAILDVYGTLDVQIAEIEINLD